MKLRRLFQNYYNYTRGSLNIPSHTGSLNAILKQPLMYLFALFYSMINLLHLS